MHNPTAADRLRVLVVDDCQDTRHTISLLLQLWGHDVRDARDGPAALTAAHAFRPHVVLLDIALPHLDGYRVARQLRQALGLGAALLIAVTGYGSDQDCARARESGFDHHLLKP